MVPSWAFVLAFIRSPLLGAVEWFGQPRAHNESEYADVPRLSILPLLKWATPSLRTRFPISAIMASAFAPHILLSSPAPKTTIVRPAILGHYVIAHQGMMYNPCRHGAGSVKYDCLLPTLALAEGVHYHPLRSEWAQGRVSTPRSKPVCILIMLGHIAA